MSFGKLNGFAKIVKRTISKDSAGFKVENDIVIAAVRCYHEQRHGSYRWANLAAFSQATDRFVIRINPAVDVKIGYYIYYKNVWFKILSAENVKECGMYYEIYAEKAVSVLG